MSEKQLDASMAYEMLRAMWKMNIITVIVLGSVILISNLAWVWAWQSYDYVTTETKVIQETTGGGSTNYTEKGDINNGKADGN